MGAIPTILVYLADGSPCVINESDFDASVHSLEAPKKKAAKKKAAKKKAD